MFAQERLPLDDRVERIELMATVQRALYDHMVQSIRNRTGEYKPEDLGLLMDGAEDEALRIVLIDAPRPVDPVIMNSLRDAWRQTLARPSSIG